MKTHYFTLGLEHYHLLGDIEFTCNTPIRVEAENSEDARDRMFLAFGKAWAFQYSQENWETLRAKDQGSYTAPARPARGRANQLG